MVNMIECGFGLVDFIILNSLSTFSCCVLLLLLTLTDSLSLFLTSLKNLRENSLFMNHNGQQKLVAIPVLTQFSMVFLMMCKVFRAFFEEEHVTA